MGKLCVDDTFYSTEFPEGYINISSKDLPDPCEIRAIIPGTVLDVSVKKGQRVSREQVVILLEAMKMLNEIESGLEGQIDEIFVSPGDNVEKNQLMIRIVK
ncbi:MAG: acetyl-CoA carboxylase biotin carboxyl carrier protein subunit [Deltaproteobacteria bacterium]|nr:acetyl-CoA carboxylase biotin carboxyl carrier protein subunit [Deltaproteobacteria bacterium]